MDITLDKIFEIASRNDYKIFYNNGVYDYNLNIWGFRSNDKNTSTYNDVFVVFYQKLKGGWTMIQFEGTTDPSDIILKQPMNELGTAIVVPGQYTSLWSFGFHKNRRDHKALVQFKPVTVYRDNNKDTTIDEELLRYTGMFGINMHHGSLNSTDLIGLWSAGCQVHKDIKRYNNEFIPLIESSVKEGNKTFTYTLCVENDLI